MVLRQRSSWGEALHHALQGAPSLRSSRKLGDHLLAGPAQQQRRCISRSDAPALEIEQLIVLKLLHGGAVGATHIVRHDLKLGLGVHPGPIRQQQVAA